MNDPLFTRTTNFNLWTIGNRQYYSPMLRVPGGLAPLGPAVTPRVRPSLVLRSVLSRSAGDVTDDAAPDGKSRSIPQ